MAKCSVIFQSEEQNFILVCALKFQDQHFFSKIASFSYRIYMSPDALYDAQKPSSELLRCWVQKHTDLLIQERKVEQEESKLLLSKCPPKQLERNGVALLGLGVVSHNVGLGGKM